MNKELQKRIKLLNCRANAFIICLGIAAVFLLLGGFFVSDSESRIFGLILLAIAGVNIVIFVYVILAAKNDAKAFEARPCVLCSHTGIKYDDFIKELEDLSKKGKRLSISENLHYLKKVCTLQRLYIEQTTSPKENLITQKNVFSEKQRKNLSCRTVIMTNTKFIKPYS